MKYKAGKKWHTITLEERDSPFSLSMDLFGTPHEYKAIVKIIDEFGAWWLDENGVKYPAPGSIMRVPNTINFTVYEEQP